VLKPYSGSVRLPRERRGIGRCMRCVCVKCAEGRLCRSEQLVGLSGISIACTAFPIGWLCGTAVEGRSLAGELSLSCARPVADV